MIKFFLNKQIDKKTEKSPDYWGFVEIDGVKHKAAAWAGVNQKGDYISVQLTEETGAYSSSRPAATPADDKAGNPPRGGWKPSSINDDEIPF